MSGPVLILPGLYNSGPEHWQSYWERGHREFLERAEELARAWGSELVNIGPAGHVNSASGLGDWPAGFALLERLRR